MRCGITGVETDNKWKGIPTSKEAIEEARELMKEDPSLTMRKALVKFQKIWLEDMRIESPFAKVAQDSIPEVDHAI